MAAPVNVQAQLNFSPQSLNAASKQIQSAFGGINLPTKTVNQFNNALGRITGQASEFDKSLNAATARVFAFGAAVSIINGISSAFKGLVSTTIEVEKRLIEINSIFGATQKEFAKFRNEIFAVAKNTGQTFATVADGAAELARQGLSAAETAKRLNASLILTRVSGLDAVSSVEALTAAINGFTSAGLQAEQIVNKIIAVDTAFAVSAKDLADGFQRAGSTAEDAGVSFDELLGLITAVQQKTARGGAVIGNAFKSIFTRLSRSTTIQELQNLGVAIDASQSGVQKLQALSTALETISDPGQAAKIKELAGGVFQINVVSAALKDLGNDASIFADATTKAGQATNEAFSKNVALNEALSAQFNALVQSVTEFGSRIGNLTVAPIIKDLLAAGNFLINGLNNLFDPESGNALAKGLLGSIAKFLSGPGLVIVSTAFFKLFKLVSKFAADGLRDVFKIGTESEKIAQIEAGIVNLLAQDENLRNTIASTTATQAQKEKAIIDAIRQENQLLQAQQTIVRQLASTARAAGVAGFGATQGFTNKKGQRGYAAGFQEEEAMAKLLGADSGVRAKRSKGTIDGRKFIMNNREVEIPNFGRNGDSAVIPMYSGGYVPNFVGVGKNLDQIQGMSLSALKQLIGTKKFQSVNDNDPVKRAAIQRRNSLAGEKGAKAAKTVTLTASQLADFPFLIPNGGSSQLLGSKKSGQATIKGKKIPYQLAGQIPYSFPTVSGKALDTAADPYDAQLERKVGNQIVDSAIAYARLLSPPSSNKSTPSEVRKRVIGQKGGRGAIQAAVGAAFEAAVSSSLGIKEGLSVGGADFDVPSGTKGQTKKELADLFRIKQNFTAAEFKASGSEGNINSYVAKVIKAKRLAAAGYIPNYAASGLKDAIGRELDGTGVKASQVRVSQDKKFAGASNPSGLVVTNTRDEPRGVRDIPNFAKGGGAGGLLSGGSLLTGFFLSGLLSGVDTLGQKFNENAKIAESLSAKQEKLNNQISKTTDEDTLSKLNGELKNVEKELSIASKEASSFSSNLSLATNTLSSLAFVLPQIVGGGGLKGSIGSLKGGFGAAKGFFQKPLSASKNVTFGISRSQRLQDAGFGGNNAFVGQRNKSTGTKKVFSGKAFLGSASRVAGGVGLAAGLGTLIGSGLEKAFDISGRVSGLRKNSSFDGGFTGRIQNQNAATAFSKELPKSLERNRKSLIDLQKTLRQSIKVQTTVIKATGQSSAQRSRNRLGLGGLDSQIRLSDGFAGIAKEFQKDTAQNRAREFNRKQGVTRTKALDQIDVSLSKAADALGSATTKKGEAQNASIFSNALKASFPSLAKLGEGQQVAALTSLSKGNNARALQAQELLNVRDKVNQASSATGDSNRAQLIKRFTDFANSAREQSQNVGRDPELFDNTLKKLEEISLEVDPEGSFGNDVIEALKSGATTFTKLQEEVLLNDVQERGRLAKETLADQEKFVSQLREVFDTDIDNIGGSTKVSSSFNNIDSASEAKQLAKLFGLDAVTETASILEKDRVTVDQIRKSEGFQRGDKNFREGGLGAAIQKAFSTVNTSFLDNVKELGLGTQRDISTASTFGEIQDFFTKLQSGQLTNFQTFQSERSQALRGAEFLGQALDQGQINAQLAPLVEQFLNSTLLAIQNAQGAGTLNAGFQNDRVGALRGQVEAVGNEAAGRADAATDAALTEVARNAGLKIETTTTNIVNNLASSGDRITAALDQISERINQIEIGNSAVPGVTDAAQIASPQ